MGTVRLVGWVLGLLLVLLPSLAKAARTTVTVTIDELEVADGDHPNGFPAEMQFFAATGEFFQHPTTRPANWDMFARLCVDSNEEGCTRVVHNPAWTFSTDVDPMAGELLFGFVVHDEVANTSNWAIALSPPDNLVGLHERGLYLEVDPAMQTWEVRSDPFSTENPTQSMGNVGGVGLPDHLNAIVRFTVTFVECIPTGIPESVCNGDDDDCDGAVDEEETQKTCGYGICASTGIERCDGGTQVDTCVPGQPGFEVLDGLDNDCDQQVDDCDTNTFIICCGLTGTAQCTNGMPSGPCEVSCDAVVPTCGVVEGVKSCGGATCEPLPNGQEEVLDGDDNDCDGDVDECEGGTIACTAPLRTCAQHAGTADCSSGTPGVCIPNDLGDLSVCPLPSCLSGVVDTTDTDEDGLYDCWETQGIDSNGDGTVDLVLPDADPSRKNLYLEIDYMAEHVPTAEAVRRVVDAFANAPVSNPVGPTGITLTVDVSDDLGPETTIIAFPSSPGQSPLLGCSDPAEPGDADFDTLKSQNFGTGTEKSNPASLDAKRLAYRYSIFAHRLKGGSWSGCAEIDGNDFIVSLSQHWGANAPEFFIDMQAATLMHEFGHNLGLGHGGFELTNNCKPQYVSIMNYAYQFNNYAAARRLDYSRQVLATLDESALLESAGLGPNAPADGTAIAFGPTPVTTSLAQGPINWDRDPAGTISQTPLLDPIDINNFGIAGCLGFETVMQGSEDWSSLVYTVFGSFEFADGARVAVAVEDATPDDFIAADSDGDGVSNMADNCVFTPNPDQADANGDNVGDVCPISPVADCVDWLGPNDYRAQFGYMNAERGGVYVQVGTHNTFQPAPADRDQTQEFLSGRVRDAFRVSFNGSPLSWLLGGVKGTASTGLMACSADADADGLPNGRDNCPFVANPGQLDADGNGVGDACPADDALGFEDPSAWRLDKGTAMLVSSVEHTQGAFSLQVTGGNYLEITSTALDTSHLRALFPPATPNAVAYDVFIPAPPPNPYWLGLSQLYVSIPSAGIHHQFIGQVELTGRTLNAWNTLLITLPGNVLAALATNRTDFAFHIGLNVPAGGPPFRFDNMKFVRTP
jgi:hypothetical protein